MDQESYDSLASLRRNFHRYPEPAWREFYTTSRLVDELERIPDVTVAFGADAVAESARMGVPETAEIESWMAEARERGAREDVLEAAAGGLTGAVATFSRGTGPSVGLRVDIDALLRTESEADSHVPAAEGFRSENEGVMHACGHDAHMAIGIGVLREIVDSEFEGTLTVLFQPAEEVAGGGKPMAEAGHLDDVDYFFAIHVGLDHPTGEVVAGIDDFLAVNHFYAEFEGEPAHAGAHPEAGRNAVQAMATAIQNLYAIPRHDDGATRVNAGRAGGGSATNIIPESAFVDGEVRGQTTALMEYMRERADRVLDAAADMHGCTVDVETVGQAPSARSDRELADVVFDIASAHPDVDSPRERDALGGSEDATYLMQTVQDHGGWATYVGIGTDHPGGHHTSTFDVDEASIPIGVEVVRDSILRIAELDPLAP